MNSFMKISESGELLFDPSVIQILNENSSLKQNEETKQFKSWIDIERDEGSKKIRSAPLNIVKRWADKLNMSQLPDFSSQSDLSSGVYEGGFKIWEGCRDLVKFLAFDKDILERLSIIDCKILELGAGSCLPSISLLLKLMNCDTPINCTFHLHDYNWQVLASLGLLNLHHNVPTDQLRLLLESRRICFYSGDWKEFSVPSRYDLIMMSETIYNFDSYDSLHRVLDEHLKHDGIILMAAKQMYFGNSGDVFRWTVLLETKNIFKVVKRHKILHEGVPRIIMILERKEQVR